MLILDVVRNNAMRRYTKFMYPGLNDARLPDFDKSVRIPPNPKSESINYKTMESKICVKYDSYSDSSTCENY